MENNIQPLVSVPVITYNSAKFVLETLESIKAQTYPNIELIISDDCSTDDTVYLCRKWVEKHKKRFVRTQIITSDINTGVSANLNRAEAACRGDWVKIIAGDDLLLNDCVETCVVFALNNGVNYLFGKVEVFDKNTKYAKEFTEILSKRNDLMSKMSMADLYNAIISEEINCLAPTFFYNRNDMINMNVKNDTRIPMIEDFPRWLNLLKKGCEFIFIDKIIVRYRLGGISTSDMWTSPMMYKNKRLMYFYYQFDYLYSLNPNKTLMDIVDFEHNLYLEMYQTINQLRNSKAYKLGNIVLSPIRWVANMFKIITHKMFN